MNVRKGGITLTAATERLTDHGEPFAKVSQSEPKEPDLRPHPVAGCSQGGEQHGQREGLLMSKQEGVRSCHCPSMHSYWLRLEPVTDDPVRRFPGGEER
jgi:hypothetical protein